MSPLTGLPLHRASAIQTDAPLATVLTQDERVVMTESMNFLHQFESSPINAALVQFRKLLEAEISAEDAVRQAA